MPHIAIDRPPRNANDSLTVGQARRCCTKRHQLGLRRALKGLSTCREMHNEMSRLLYSKNTFVFDFSDEMYLKSQKQWINASACDVERQCKNLFDYSRADVPFHRNIFARFLYQIGRRNASSLTTLEFQIDKCHFEQDKWESQMVEMVKQISLLLNLYVPSLIDLTFICELDGYEPCHNGAEDFVDEKIYNVLLENRAMLSGLKRLELDEFRRDSEIFEKFKKFQRGVIRDSDGNPI